MNGARRVRRNNTMMSALAAEDNPVTLIRPALSRRWEAARGKAGNCSTSAKMFADERQKHFLLILPSPMK